MDRVGCLKLILCGDRVAQWIRRLTSDQKIGGSSPFTVVSFFPLFFVQKDLYKMFKLVFDCRIILHFLLSIFFRNVS